MVSIFKRNTLAKSFSALLLVLCSFASYGKQIPTVTAILKTDPSFAPSVNAGDNSYVNVPLVSGTRDYNVKNTIALKYDLNTDTFFLSEVSVRVVVIIERNDAYGNPLPTITTNLIINSNNTLNRPMIDAAYENLVDGYEIKTKIKGIVVNGVSVNTLPRYVSVESSIDMDRYYEFWDKSITIPDNNSLVPVDHDCDGINDELELTWSVPTAIPEEYQVEWYFVSNYAPGGGSYPPSDYTTDFKNNSTRITTTGNSFRVSMLYPDGYIVFRVRAVGRDYLDPTKYIYGDWNVADKVNIGSLPRYYSYAITGHESIKNWQYSSTYAEEGKKKEVISYFDGSLRNRQTVTKINSDKNAIIGETMYDYQGRPAVNILPAPGIICRNPSSEGALRYYPGFNQNNYNGGAYAKVDFDEDAGNCTIAAGSAAYKSGSSKYYSGNNPVQDAQQAYLPDAKEYPFTQVEYTPDNTGRIRSQSGVGPNFQLGSGKETKYLYGQPNQLQVDRLFGSEAGDASHYKKNITIDGNGQVSVNYLDQEGKTIATALAGIPPTNNTGEMRVDSLEYAAQNQTEYTVDLFNKNAFGLSSLNAVAPSNDQINFSSQLLVPFKSVYDFEYKLSIDTLNDACLRPNICVSCVYNMEIQIRNECGEDLVTSVSPFKPIKKVMGRVDTTGNKLTFNVNCISPTLFQDPESISLVLDPGVYTISKILKVNQQAKDYYVKKYTDSVYNSCVKTLRYFQKAELTGLDTSDCYNSCASCVAALGAKDDFVASAKGTAEQWEFLFLQCNEPCREKTICQTSYEMLLSDVSPGGQYGRYNTATFDASSEPVSVYNTANVLKPNIIPNQHAHWKMPLMRLNGNMYNMYLDENGVRTKINVSQLSPGVVQPPVDNTALVYTDNSTGLKYTYPENLKNLSDFIGVWNSNFARSLVIYHPEYAYYVSCSDQAIVFSNDIRSSDALDSLMFAAESFNKAVSSGFILPGYTTITPAINVVKNTWSSGTQPYDPFFTNTMFKYGTSANPVTGEKTSINMNGGNYYNVNVQAEMTSAINNYLTANSTVYTMMDVAAILARCGNIFGTSAPSSACLAFGHDFYAPGSVLNDTIRNAEWRIYRHLYFSQKQKLQFKRMNFYAKYCSDDYSNYYGGGNACIGSSTYDVFNSNMITLNSGIPDPNSPYFDSSQPCAYDGYMNYPGATKRFYDPADTGLNPDNAAVQLNLSTGQCPLGLEMQVFLNAMTQTHSLTTNNLNLSLVNEFSAGLYNAIITNATTSPFVALKWQPSISGSILTANIVDPTSTIKCIVKLNISGSGITNFSNIIGISQLVYDPTGGSNGAFEAVAIYVSGSATLSANIKGSSSCMDLKNCTTQQFDCHPNQFSNDLFNLINYLALNGTLFNTTPTPLSSIPSFSSLVTPAITSILGSSIYNMECQFLSGFDMLIIYDVTNPSKRIAFYFVLPPGSSISSITSFSNFQVNTSGTYSMLGNIPGSTVSIRGYVELDVPPVYKRILDLGNCVPLRADCSEKEHLVRNDLEVLIREVLDPYTFAVGNANFYNMINFSALLRSYVSTTINATSSTHVVSYSAYPNYDTITVRYTTSPANAFSDCNFKLYHYRNDGVVLNFQNIVNISGLTGIGVPDINGNYYQFKALATYSVGSNPVETDTIYGSSCWPIKNCRYCAEQIATAIPLTASSQIYSTGFNRATNTPYNGTNNGNFDPYWQVVKIQPLNGAYTPTGSPTFPGTNAYDIALGGSVPMAQTGYINLYNTAASSPQRQIVTYRTTFTLPSSLPSSPLHVLVINARADDAIYNITVNGSTFFSGIGGSSYTGPPATAVVNSLTGLVPGVNWIEISAADLGLAVLGMAAQVYVDIDASALACGGTPDSAFVFPAYTKYDNPCARQKVNLALQNAANKYQQYIDEITTTFANKYTQHCLGALEDFTYKYTDKEYHHTLYYYDQAGNLIKTIPPEGVEYVPVTAYSDALEQQIISDRTSGQQSVFTSHRMATKYIYNSLNQLVFQSVPDHDNMDICDGLNTNGLDTGLVVNAIQFVSPNKGYLCGEVKTGSVTRGYVYTSDDGGNAWTRVDGVTSGDLQKVQFTSSSKGFAISTFGMIFKTIDGGNSWDLLTSLYNLPGGTSYRDVLNDVYFRGSFGIVGGIAGATSPIFYTNNAGLSFLQATVTGATAGDTITGFTYNGIYVATAKNGIAGKLFISTNGSNWTKANFAANHLKRVQFISNTQAYAIGDEGTLMRLSQSIAITGSPEFQLVPTGMLGKFIDVYFKNITDGVAIIESQPNKGQIFKTFDGGVTWQLLSAAGDYYNSLALFNAAGSKLIAAGKNGVMAKVLLSTAPFGISKMSMPDTKELSYADAYDGGSSNVAAIGVSNASRLIYTSYNAHATAPTWFTTDASAGGSPILNDTIFKKVVMLASSPSNPNIEGILLTSTGKLYSFSKPYAAGMSFQLISVAGAFFNDLTANGQTFSAPVYAFDTLGKKVYRFNFSGSTAIPTALGSVSGNINAIDINNAGTDAIMVGNSGHIEYASNIASTWNNVSLNSIPVALTDVQFVAGTTFIASGIDGSLWQNYNNNTSWYLRNSGTVEKLNAIAVNTTGKGLVCGNNGKLFRISNVTALAPSLANVATSLSANLNDVALEPGGNSAYVTAANGKVLYMSNYNTSLPVIAAQSSPVSINGVAYKNGSLATVVGNNALISDYDGINAMTVKNIFPDGMISIHFSDVNNGYVIDSSDVIRRTSDGGTTWSVILPKQNVKLTKIFSTGPNTGIMIGLKKYVAIINNSTLSHPAISVPGSIIHFYDINFDATKTNGILVGSLKRAVSVVGNTFTYLGQAPGTAADFRAVHVFNNNTFIAGGTKGQIYYYKSGSFKPQMAYTLPAGISATNITFKDAYFHDDYTGYIVGDNGAALKTDLTDEIANVGTTSNSINWNPFCMDALYMSYTSTSQVSDLDFRAIACANRTHLMIGGADNNLTIAGIAPNRYARLLKEESSYYSARFWYDKLGRMILSQNTKQFNKTNPAAPLVRHAFSYTLYDALGRIAEVGEKFENYTGGEPKMTSIFGSLVNGFYNNNVVDNTKFSTWVSATGDRREVTKTYYDVQNILPGSYVQQNLRKRVASTTFEDVFDGNDLTYNHASHYSYDIHGNVNSLWQENTQVGVSGEEIKQTDYRYDLVSGKVNKIIYSPGLPDQFIHRYAYDADNRITHVETSSNDLHYDLDAKYFYYAHGPLARVEYGKSQVQGLDYAYTLQGWIKGMNSNLLVKETDMGSDGDRSFTNPNGNFARDIVGYTLNYYYGDYNAINSLKWNTASTRFEAYTINSDLLNSSSDLFNGNISSMVTSISSMNTRVERDPGPIGPFGGDPEEGEEVVHGTNALILGNSYRYDQLNRLKRSFSFTNIDNNEWLNDGSTLPGLYRNTFSYDANGNIKTQVKRDSVGELTDSLVYNYEKDINGKLFRNRLYHVNDDVTSTPPGFGDITDQGPFTPGTTINTVNNYSFDEIGNLISDRAEEIDTIRWTVYGKIKAIIRTSTSSKDNLFFDYDATGNRIAKHNYDAANVWKSSTYYQRDAQGNVLSVYGKKTDPASSSLSYKLSEQHLYGSSRIGMTHPDFEMIGVLPPQDTSKSYLGLKQYELSNHLGNVLTTISDKKIAIADHGTPTFIDYYVPDIVNATDYYAFGSPMPGRRFNNDKYRYGFNGKENDDEISGSGNSLDFEAREYDPRIGRTWTIDPHSAKYPSLSGYSMFNNNPIIYVDKTGKDYDYSVTIIKDKNGTAIGKVVNVEIKVKVLNLSSTPMADSDLSAPDSRGNGVYNYETTSGFTDSKGNVKILPTTVNVSTSFTMIKDVNEVKPGENLMLVVNDVSSSTDGNWAGVAEMRGNISAVEAGYVNKNGWTQLALHELGHNLGMEDNYTSTSPGNGMMGSLTNGGEKTVTGNLRSSLEEKKYMGMHQKTQDGKQFSGDVRDKVKSFIRSNTNANPADKRVQKK